MKMNVDLRDGLWLIVTLVLLSLLGREWFRANSIAAEIRELRTAERPLQFNNANLVEADYFVYLKYGEQSKIDWPSLHKLGFKQGTRVTKSLRSKTGKEAYQELFGPQVEVVEDIESSEVMGRPIYFIRAKQTAESK